MRIHRYLAAAVAAAFMAVAPACANAESEYWRQRVSLFDILPIERNDIVFLGNSITDGGEFAELFGMPNVKNRGIQSDVISGVAKRLRQVTAGKPKKIFLLIGINDISHNLTVDRIASDYRDLVRRIRRETPATKLYIQSIFPINNDFGRYRNLKGKEQTLKELNSRLSRIASEEGAEFVDLTPALADPKTGKLTREYTNDGLHLTGKGYRVWTDAIRDLVK